MYRFIIFLVLISYIKLHSQGSNTCIGAQGNQITLPFFTNNQSTCGDINDYNGTNPCQTTTNGNYFGGQDWLYSFTPAQDGYINIVINDIISSGFAYPTVTLLSACPGTSNSCIGFVLSDPINGGGFLVREVQGGQTYWILIDGYTWSNFFTNCFQFDLSVSLIPIITQPSCNNVNFNSGTLSGWQGTTGRSVQSSAGSATPNYNSTAYGLVVGRHTIMNGGTDPCGGFSRVAPLGNPFSVRLGNNDVNAEAEQLIQRFLVTSSNSSFTYRYAVVFEDPNHLTTEQPFFKAIVKDQNGVTIQCSEFIVSAGGTLPGFFNSTTCSGVVYKPWSTVNVDLGNYIGQVVTAEFTTGDCSQGAHYGYAYIDASCSSSLLEALDDTICLGESVTISAPPGYQSYTWLPGNQTTPIITVAPAQSTVYQLNLVSQNGCLVTTQFTITVVPLPSPIIIYTD